MNKQTAIRKITNQELTFVVGGKKKKCSWSGANKAIVNGAIGGAAGGLGAAGLNGLLGGLAYGVTQCIM